MTIEYEKLVSPYLNEISSKVRELMADPNLSSDDKSEALDEIMEFVAEIFDENFVWEGVANHGLLSSDYEQAPKPNGDD
jgi:hypothetical protein